MKISAAVKMETGHIALGVAALTAVMLAIFWIFGAMDASVLWGALLGSGYAVLNFFLLGITVQKAAGMEKEGKAKSLIQFSYSLRMLALFGVAVLGFVLSCFHWAAVIIPMIFPRVTILMMGFRKPKGKEGKAEDGT